MCLADDSLNGAKWVRQDHATVSKHCCSLKRTDTRMQAYVICRQVVRCRARLRSVFVYPRPHRRDVLSGRKSSGRITGSILYDGQAPTKAFLRAATGYVEQGITLVSVFTAREMLLYTAQVRHTQCACSTELATSTMCEHVATWEHAARYTHAVVRVCSACSCGAHGERPEACRRQLWTSLCRNCN